MTPPSNLPEVYGLGQGHRRMVRETRSQELAVRSLHRKFAAVVRASVLVLFGLAMVVYPIYGTLSPAAHAAEKVPGVILGAIPDTVSVILGEAPTLTEGAPPLPDPADLNYYLATSNVYVVSSLLPNCDGSTEWDSSGGNGGMKEEDLCVLWNGVHKVRSDAAIPLAQLNHAFKLEYGRDICLESGYRSIGDQYHVKSIRGRLAARPGQSPHGWGIAIDICRIDSRGEKFDWFKANAPAYGWDNPPWAVSSLYEPWHWEYFISNPGNSFTQGPGSSNDPVPELEPTTAPTTTPTPEEPPPPPPPPAPEPEPTA